ncbi:glycoside hydrolase family 43 protein [Actinotalea caeni]|uniref:glycoside hydrolase family 43 protein n=1 Tax=Actinotalea caeni TaxID=1348467 RepID=UPI0012E29A50|nr:glycoside hydrolase family 43 protein [Actinotalea caeni]
MVTPLGLEDIQIRDPFLLTVPEEGVHYLFGSTDADPWRPPATGFDCYRSADLRVWEGPLPAFRPPVGFWSDRNFWAPEVHRHRDRFYMFASFKADGVPRGTQVLVADRAEGPYQPWSDGPVTPSGWECLDGTLHVDDDGHPWIVYCHEWVQVVDGEVVAQRLADDLREAQGEPVVLFRASEAPWVRPVQHRQLPPGAQGYVTDGPFLHRLATGTLVMLWSSMGESGYAMGLARSDGGVLGPWEQLPDPVWARDGGHGMIARTLQGDLVITLHQPNRTPEERAVIRRLAETPDGLRLLTD